MPVFLFLFAIFAIVQRVNGGNILVIMMVGDHSHRMAFQPLFEELANRNHNLTILSYKSIPFKNITEINGPDIYEIIRSIPDPIQLKLSKTPFNYFQCAQIFCAVCSEYFEMTEMKTIQESSFDIVMVDALANECSLGLINHLKSPFIFLSPMIPPVWTTPQFGAPSLPSLEPLTMSTSSYKHKMNFVERLINFYEYVKCFFYEKPKFDSEIEEFYRKYFPDSPSVPEITRNASLILSNTFTGFEYPRLMFADIIEVAGMHLKPGKPLKGELKDFLSDSRDEFIYFSLGSFVQGKNLPKPVIQSFINVFRKLKLKVIWKFEDELPNLPSNIFMRKWLPQNDLLAQKNIKLFISQCGLLSIQEAVYHGVTMLGIPIFADQDANFDRVEEFEMGKRLELEDVNESNLEKAINELLNNPKYKENADIVSDRFRNRAVDPLSLAVHWVELVMRHKGAKYLRSIARDFSYIKLYSIDVVATIIGCFIFILLSVYYILSRCILRNTRVVNAKHKIN